LEKLAQIIIKNNIDELFSLLKSNKKDMKAYRKNIATIKESINHILPDKQPEYSHYINYLTSLRTYINDLKSQLKQKDEEIEKLREGISNFNDIIKEREAEAESYRKLYNEVKSVLRIGYNESHAEVLLAAGYKKLYFELLHAIAGVLPEVSVAQFHDETIKAISDYEEERTGLEQTLSEIEKICDDASVCHPDNKLEFKVRCLAETLERYKPYMQKASDRNAEKLKLLSLLKTQSYVSNVLIEYKKWLRERKSKRAGKK
jgi:chromosome segregation ATPase